MDGSGIITLYNIDTLSGQNTSTESRLERKEVWSVKWAEVWCSFVELQFVKVFVICLLYLCILLVKNYKNLTMG